MPTFKTQFSTYTTSVVRLLVGIIVFALGTTVSSAQSSEDDGLAAIDFRRASPVKVAPAVISVPKSEMGLILWFMGTRQIRSVDSVQESTSNQSAKKHLINCGASPNRILSRSFMKKAVNYGISIC